MIRQTRIWVDSAFKKKLKKAAVEEELSVLEYTKRLARNEDMNKINEIKNELEKKNRVKIL